MKSTSSRAVAIRRAGAFDAARLAALAERTFVDTFAADNDPADMDAYVAQAFGESVQRAELRDPSITVFFAERDGEPAGYVMLRDEPHADVPARHAVEIARLYAAREAIGTGVGAALMDAALAEAAARGADAVWLGVWEHNARAIAFYARHGFRDVGAQHFQLGTDRQCDRVMRRDLEAAR